MRLARANSSICRGTRQGYLSGCGMALWLVAQAVHATSGCDNPMRPDVLIKNARIFDGTGAPERRGGLAICGQRVTRLGDVRGMKGVTEVDAQGLAVAPGFINMLSWANESLIQDGRSLSDLTQGITLEIFGEGDSMGPLTQAMKADLRKKQVDISYEINWTSLAEYLDQLVRRGISTNVASFVGATTVRTHELGEGERAPSAEELSHMQELVRQAMREGALGVSSALIYAPGVYAKTHELKALASAAAEFGGGYISHLRGESARLLKSLDELIDIARGTKAHAEVYHLKAAGKSNWPKMRLAIEHIEAARRAGIDVSANMYSYSAAASGLDATMPPWVKADGLDAWIERLHEPKIRSRLMQQMRVSGGTWDNYLREVESPEQILLVRFKQESLKPLIGKTLGQVASLRRESPEEAAIDLVVEDRSRVGAVYFLMSEDNVRLGLAQPWVSLGSDEASQAPEGVFNRSRPHPRAYGNVARFLGHYVREEKLIPLTEAIRRLTRLPAQNWNLKGRGCIQPGCYADVVVFDPDTLIDRATYEDPQQFSEGMRHVFVNGQQVIRDGVHTGVLAGQIVRGPGWSGWKAASPKFQASLGAP